MESETWKPSPIAPAGRTWHEVRHQILQPNLRWSYKSAKAGECTFGLATFWPESQCRNFSNLKDLKIIKELKCLRCLHDILLALGLQYSWSRSSGHARRPEQIRGQIAPTLWQHGHNFDTLYTLYASVSELLRSTSFWSSRTPWPQSELPFEFKWRCVDVYVDVMRMCKRLNFACQSLMTLPRHPLSGASEASALALNCPETFFLLLGFPRQGSWTSFPHLKHKQTRVAFNKIILASFSPFFILIHPH